MAAFQPQGNVDTEAGGNGQPFSPVEPTTPMYPGAGNVQSDTANVNAALGYGRIYMPQQQDNGGMDYYYQLGQQLLRMQQQMMQQQQRQPMAPAGGGGAAPQGSLNLTPSPLTAGFDMGWLASRLNAASANGAAIQGMGKNPGQGSIPVSGKGGGGGGGKGGGGFSGFSGTNDGNLMAPLPGDVSY